MFIYVCQVYFVVAFLVETDSLVLRLGGAEERAMWQVRMKGRYWEVYNQDTFDILATFMTRSDACAKCKSLNQNIMYNL